MAGKKQEKEINLHPLLSRVMETGNPIIEGDTATFLWQGRITPGFIDDLSDWGATPRKLERISPGLWVVTLTLPLNAYLEYAFQDLKTGKNLMDPFNRRRVSNGMGNWNNYFYMPKGRPTPYANLKPGNKAGVITRHEVSTNDFARGKKRTIYLYQPQVESPVPLLVVYDGPDYLKRARLNVIVDNLIARGRIQPFAMALLQNGHQARLIEYACSDATLNFLIDSILPLARKHLNLTPPGEGTYGVMGGSMGGLMALYTAMRLPQPFGKVLSQSGAFHIPDFEFILTNLVRYQPKKEIKVWMDVGRFETLLDCNRAMHNLLEEKGYNVSYREFSGGHNYTAWRDDLSHGLESLFKPR